MCILAHLLYITPVLDHNVTGGPLKLAYHVSVDSVCFPEFLSAW